MLAFININIISIKVKGINSSNVRTLNINNIDLSLSTFLNKGSKVLYIRLFNVLMDR